MSAAVEKKLIYNHFALNTAGKSNPLSIRDSTPEEDCRME